jgi:hypothetical protein
MEGPSDAERVARVKEEFAHDITLRDTPTP